jgi:hypothetical protein
MDSVDWKVFDPSYGDGTGIYMLLKQWKDDVIEMEDALSSIGKEVAHQMDPYPIAFLSLVCVLQICKNKRFCNIESILYFISVIEIPRGKFNIKIKDNVRNLYESTLDKFLNYILDTKKEKWTEKEIILYASIVASRKENSDIACFLFQLYDVEVRNNIISTDIVLSEFP